MQTPPPDNTAGIDRLRAVMACLRDPAAGCPWDLVQDFASIAPYTIEEAYEVADAIARGTYDELCGELGDLLLQVVYHARIAEEGGHFDFDAVAHRVAAKMIARHPHVFTAGTPEEETPPDAAAQPRAWEAHKAAERTRKAAEDGRVPSALDGVARALPALTRAEKLQKRAARDGFDWPDAESTLAKVDEELAELRAEVGGTDRAALRAEMGDLLFTVANVARKLDIDPEVALRDANDKFERRYRAVERRLADDTQTAGARDLDTLERLWQAVKADERAAPDGDDTAAR